MDHLTGVMSLLEGHADVVMDGVGPSVIPSVKDIRKKFTRRRQGVGMLDKFLRRALGLDAKMAQYRDGAAFVRGVVDKVGMADFNVVWQDPAHLPTKAEIADPAAWVTRVSVTGPDPAVAATRVAVRRALTAGDPGSAPVLVACSGGADSLALLAAAVFEAREQPWPVVGVTVDHGLHEASAEVATHVIGQMAALGADETASIRVKVEGDGHGLEAAARQARYAVLEELADRFGSSTVLLGHTLDDQAETVLLGLTRGSGGRSLAGMRRTFGVFRRPLLDLTRAQTEQACRAQDIGWWTDPANDGPALHPVTGPPRRAAPARDRAGSGRRPEPGPHGRPAARGRRAPRRPRRRGVRRRCPTRCPWPRSWSSRPPSAPASCAWRRCAPAPATPSCSTTTCGPSTRC